MKNWIVIVVAAWLLAWIPSAKCKEPEKNKGKAKYAWAGEDSEFLHYMYDVNYKDVVIGEPGETREGSIDFGHFGFYVYEARDKGDMPYYWSTFEPDYLCVIPFLMRLPSDQELAATKWDVEWKLGTVMVAKGKVEITKRETVKGEVEPTGENGTGDTSDLILEWGGKLSAVLLGDFKPTEEPFVEFSVRFNVTRGYVEKATWRMSYQRQLNHGVSKDVHYDGHYQGTGGTTNLKIHQMFYGGELLFRDRWNSEDAELQSKINRGIELAAENLMGEFERSLEAVTAFVPQDPKSSPENKYNSELFGSLALRTAAYLAATGDKNHAGVQAMIQWLQKYTPAAFPMEDMYTPSLAILALDCYLSVGGLQPAGEEQCKTAMKKYADWIVAHFEKVKKAGFGYDPWPADGLDMSNTQFAVFGLEIAASWGVPVPKTVWGEVAQAVMQAMKAQGKSAAVQWVRHPSIDGKTVAKEMSTNAAVQPRGWGYKMQQAQSDPYRAMTSGGLGILAICRKRMRETKTLSKDMDKKLDAEMMSAMCWLQQNYTVSTNGRMDFHYFYSLYSLERAGVWADFQMLGGHDWYREGATALLALQNGERDFTVHNEREDAGNKANVENSLAILFWKRVPQRSFQQAVVTTK